MLYTGSWSVQETRQIPIRNSQRLTTDPLTSPGHNSHHQLQSDSAHDLRAAECAAKTLISTHQRSGSQCARTSRTEPGVRYRFCSGTCFLACFRRVCQENTAASTRRQTDSRQRGRKQNATHVVWALRRNTRLLICVVTPRTCEPALPSISCRAYSSQQVPHRPVASVGPLL